MAYGGVSSADSKSQSFDQPRADRGLDKSEELTGRDLAEIVDVLKRKFAWYGFRSIALGPVIKVQEHTISVDLMGGGVVVGRIEVERRSGVIKRWLPFHLVPA
jgi:hypothetical protein